MQSAAFWLQDFVVSTQLFSAPGVALSCRTVTRTAIFALRISIQAWYDSGTGDTLKERPMQFIVGLKVKDRSGHLTIDAEDALIAALRAKTQQPESCVMYVRRQNKRGDSRHPSAELPAAAE